MNEYNDGISDILSRYDVGTMTEYELVHEIASWKRENGHESEGKAIEAKMDGIVKGFADSLIVRLLKSDYVHVNGCIVDFVESYLSGEYYGAQFVTHCVDCWQNSDSVVDRAFAERIFREWEGKFEQLAGALYVSEANKLAEAMP